LRSSSAQFVRQQIAKSIGQSPQEEPKWMPVQKAS
jgi:hypothetical protein